jgi:hypothetical protein
MKWPLRLVGGLLAMVLTLALIGGGLLFFLGSDDYRNALVWSADAFLNATLQIKGPFSLRLAREVSLTVRGVSLRANDGSYSLTVGECQTRVRLAPLLKGVFWVESLVLADVRLEARPSANAGGFEFQGISIPRVVIEEARLHDLKFVYRESNTEKARTITLLALVIDDVNKSGPVTIDGNGRFQNRPFGVKGRMDPLAELISAARPYAVQLDITSGTLEADVDGTIARPLEGTGLDLRLSLKDPEISDTLKLLSDKAPALGALSAQMRLRGDYDAPRLDQIDARLQRPGALELNVTGEIGDLVSLSRMKLRVNAQSSNPSVTSWLLFDRRNRLKSLAVKGTVDAQDGHYRIEGLQAEATTRSGVQIGLSGTADIQKTLRRPATQARELNVQLEAPTTKALAALGAQGAGSLPGLGPVRMTARLVPYLDGVSLEGLSLAMGGPGQVRVTASGSIDAIRYARPGKPSGFNLGVDVQAAKSTYLDKYFRMKLPKLGAVHARARVRGGLPVVSIESLKLSVGPPGRRLLEADGIIRTAFRPRTSTLNIGFDVSTAELIAALKGKPPPKRLGRLRGSMSMSDTDGSWGLDRFTMVSAQTRLFQFKAAGALANLRNRPQGQIKTMLEIDDVPALGRALGVDLSGFSAYKGQGLLRLVQGRLNYEASNTLGRTMSTTRLSGSLTGNKPRLKGELDIPVLNLADFGVGKHAVAGKTAGGATNSKGSQYLFSRRALDLNILRAFDLDLKVSVSAVAGTDLSFKRLDARINLQDAVLRASPVRLEFQGGPSTVDLVIDARKKPVFSFKVSGNELSLGPLLSQVQSEVPVRGDVNLQIDVNGRGDSPHELASTLDGKFSFGLEDARVPRKYVDYLAVNVFGWVYDLAMRREPYAKLDCVMAAFAIKDGIATSHLLAADGPYLAVEGTATLDLGDETMDITLLPKQKKVLFSELTPVHIKGPMRDPEVTAVPVKSALTSLGPLALAPALPMVAIPAILGERLWATFHTHRHKAGGCARLLRKIEKRKKKESNK